MTDQTDYNTTHVYLFWAIQSSFPDWTEPKKSNLELQPENSLRT